MDRQIIVYLKLLHGSYNSIVMLLFIYQLWTGLRIRKERTSGTRSFDAIKKHRKFGPVLALLGLAGFFIGLAVVYLDKGHVMKYPMHFTAGAAIAFLIAAAYFFSRKITTEDRTWRTFHFITGVILVCLYPLQALLGLGILF